MQRFGNILTGVGLLVHLLFHEFRLKWV